MKRIKLSTRSTLLVGVTAGIFIALPLSQVIYSKQNNSYATIESKFKVMNQILYFVNQLYYETVDMETLMDGAFHGIMDQLDPHSVFISAKDQKNINELIQYAERKEVVEINLSEQQIKFGNNKINFDIDSFKKRCLLEGLDDIDISLEKSKKISSYEENIMKKKPWLN